MSEKLYDKLIRDKIPDIIIKAGKTPHTYVADNKEYHQKLIEKLKEELDEYIENSNLEELADIMEVLDALIDFHQVDKKRFYAIKNQKKQSNGGFEQRLVLTKVIDE